MQPHANLKLKESFGREGNHLAGLPTGEQVLAGVKFNIGEGLILLKGSRLDRPQKVEGINVRRKELPGGILSSVAVKGGMAVFTATDGKVRAWDAFTDLEKWTCDAQTPFFAGPAVTEKTVYAADLKGGVHAINRADGKKEWVLNLAADPATKTNGMVYGSPMVQGGRLHLATCNLSERDARIQNVVVCIGEK